MGNRATVGLVLGQPQLPAGATPTVLYVYSHWAGAELPQRLAQGLYDGRPRWGEPAYMAAILVRALIGDDWEVIDGFGLSHVPYGVPADAGRPLLLVDLRVGRVGFVDWDWAYSGTRVPELPFDYDAFIGVATWDQNASSVSASARS